MLDRARLGLAHADEARHDGEARRVGAGAAEAATLIAEAPKIGPHLEAMREKIGNALALAPGQVGLKATTNEGMGAIGREEGMYAMAVASVEKLG